jgi:FlaG/FlaF family flagellin (archaellin)
VATLPSFFSSNKANVSGVKLGKDRSGVSPVIATTIILAITVTLGLSLWSFANSGVGAATQSYSEVITDIGEFTSDRFVVINVAYAHPSANAVTLWIYNSGENPTEVNNITLTCKDCASFAPVSVGKALLTGTNPIPAKSLQQISFTSGSLTTGNTYQFQVMSSTGALQTYYQEK